MSTQKLLFVDAGINLILGAVLVLASFFPVSITNILGVPEITDGFYTSLFGAVLIGIAIALWIEARRDPMSSLVGLGLGGAVSINLCGGLLLVVWLIFGNMHLHIQGLIFLWLLALLLIAISLAELNANLRQGVENTDE